MRNGARAPRYKESRPNAKLTEPVGYADAALIFDKQPNEPPYGIALFTITQAAEFLTISVSGVRRLQQARRIPFFKVGGSLRFAKDDLESYLARQRVGPFGQ